MVVKDYFNAEEAQFLGTLPAETSTPNYASGAPTAPPTPAPTAPAQPAPVEQVQEVEWLGLLPQRELPPIDQVSLFSSGRERVPQGGDARASEFLARALCTSRRPEEDGRAR